MHYAWDILVVHKSTRLTDRKKFEAKNLLHWEHELVGEKNLSSQNLLLHNIMLYAKKPLPLSIPFHKTLYLNLIPWKSYIGIAWNTEIVYHLCIICITFLRLCLINQLWDTYRMIGWKKISVIISVAMGKLLIENF